MGKISAFSQTTNVVVNNDFWNKANQMLSSYLTEIKQITIPEKPGSSELELPWIYEIMQMMIPDIFSGDLILLDGDMHGQLIYNLTVGAILSIYPEWGMVIAVNDSEIQNLIKECSDNPYVSEDYEDITIVERYSESGMNGENLENNGEMLLEEAIFRILAANSIEGTVVIDNRIDPNNQTVQILLGVLYYKKTEVLYQPKDSNAFIDFITAS